MTLAVSRLAKHLSDGNEPSPVRVRHVIRGQVVDGASRDYRYRDLDAPFTTPELVLGDLVWPRPDAGPAFQCPLKEVIAFLLETGRRLDFERNPLLREACAAYKQVNVLGSALVEDSYRALATFYTKDIMEEEVETALGSLDDGWRKIERRNGEVCYVRPYPVRIVHIMAGNAPPLASTSILRAALSRGVHLLKVPSNDLFTTQAVLETMSQIDAAHPVVRSFSAVYWRGGETAVESALYRPQFFDKIVAWGGGDSISHVQKYMSPGLELISMDPKTSISVIGQEAFVDRNVLSQVAAAAARDVGAQEGCANSRVHFVEASVENVDLYCAELLAQLNVLSKKAAGGRSTPPDIREEVDALRLLEPHYRVWGCYDGTGLVVRSDRPVEFSPIARTVNVVPVTRLLDAARYVNVATQSVGVYPPSRRAEVRDSYCAAGAQRTMTLGRTSMMGFGRPHDGFHPLYRMVRWVLDEG